MFLANYSVLRAITGSFLAAILDGINPAITVNNILIKTSTIPPNTGKEDTLEISVILFITIFIGIFKSIVTIIPIKPDVKPTINVSALNTLEISFLLAPIALSIPISFVLYNTEI